MIGAFITFEGGEGAGKSTQIERLAGYLRQAGQIVVVTREPGGSPGAEALRALLVEGDTDRWDGLCETLLHYTARRDHLIKTILPALQAGRTVLCDRYADSTMAYQGFGHGLGVARVRQVHDLVLGDLDISRVTPDLTVILDIPVEQGLARAASRHGRETRYESMEIAFHERLRAGFHQIAEDEKARCRLLDATRPIDDLANEIAQLADGLATEAGA